MKNCQYQALIKRLKFENKKKNVQPLPFQPNSKRLGRLKFETFNSKKFWDDIMHSFRILYFDMTNGPYQAPTKRWKFQNQQKNVQKLPF